MIFKERGIMLIISIQSIAIGLWLLLHDGKMNYTKRVHAFKHADYLNSWQFAVAATAIGLLLLYAAIKNKSKLQKWLLITLNATWSIYTAVLILNELSGVPNMSWALLLGYNAIIFYSARFEVDSQ